MGNQLHQYAYALVFAKKIGGLAYVDKNFFKLNPGKLKITKRKYELNNFSFDPVVVHFFLSNYYVFNFFNRIPGLSIFLEKALKIKIINSREDINEIDAGINTFYINGVFGSILDYKIVEEEIKKMFCPNPLIQSKLSSIPGLVVKNGSVAVHIRRTDYLNDDSIHEVLGTSYYMMAMDLVKEKIRNPTFYFFGDDEKWIRENLIQSGNPNHKFINYKDGPNSYLFDFFAMKYCENIIISNSTFAWWAAYLNDDENRTIVAPGKWLKNKELNLNELYLNDWHVV